MTTTPFITLFKKEFHQQYSLALAMLLFCFLLQLITSIMAMYPEFFGHTTDPSFLGIGLFFALLTTALYAGAAAAISFSVEHEEKTFGFLRSLPVSPLTILLGKTAWVVTGTIFVLIGSLVPIFLGNATNILTEEIGYLGNTNIWLGIGVCIIEAFVWGFFWSPLCRHQIYAVLITYFCTSLTSFLAIQFSEQDISLLRNYSDASFLRLGIAAVVGIVAVFPMLRWFKNATRRDSMTGYFQYKNIFSPSLDLSVSPFFTLLCQSIWQSLILLICGLVVASISCIFLIFIYSFFSRSDFILFSNILQFCIIAFVTIFSGCVFGVDQRNQSFRFLSRCGISPGKIWWSRVLPFLCIYMLIIIFKLIYSISITNVWDINNDEPNRILVFAIFFFLIPFSAGTFVSIYCRSMLVSVALTGVISILLFSWMNIGMVLYRFNPLWTTLPLMVMLLVASRLRTADWLRERQTWKDLLKPLIPFFITVIIILLAVPLVRIYSIPYVSLEEVEAVLDKANIAERLSPEERKKLFQETSARLTQKLTEEDIDRIKAWRRIVFLFRDISRFDYDRNVNSYNKEQLKTYLRNKNTNLKEAIQTMPLFETWLLYNYEIKTRIVNGGLKNILLPDLDGTMEKLVLTRCDYFPWEKTRILRRFNWQLRYYLYSCDPERVYQFYYQHEAYRKVNMPTYYAICLPDYLEIQKILNRTDLSHGIFDSLPDEWKTQSDYFFAANLFRLQLVHTALHRWSLEHDHILRKSILPQSLDELVGIYLDEIPRDPRTGEEMEYYPTWNESLNNQMPPYIFRYGHELHGFQKPDRPCLKLGNIVLDIQFFSVLE
ncbi:MAG: hypothetical protein LBC02_01880 [Planctomycetaceae bacterium]|jgi:hypothetical protein|nr:hypothetical protein [Planctomycetaceae bacterium]